MSDSTQKLELAPRPQLLTPAVTTVAEPVNALEVQGVEEMQEVQAAAELSVTKPAMRHPIKRIEQPTAGELPVAKPVTRHPIRRPKLEAAAAQQRAEELAEKAANLVGQKDITAVCRQKVPYGAFFEVTDGPAKSISGLLHLNALPGGERELEALNIGDVLTLDITAVLVTTKRGKAVIKLGFDGFGKERRAQETHRAVFARGAVAEIG